MFTLDSPRRLCDWCREGWIVSRPVLLYVMNINGWERKESAGGMVIGEMSIGCSCRGRRIASLPLGEQTPFPYSTDCLLTDHCCVVTLTIEEEPEENITMDGLDDFAAEIMTSQCRRQQLSGDCVVSPPTLSEAPTPRSALIRTLVNITQIRNRRRLGEIRLCIQTHPCPSTCSHVSTS